MTRYYARKFKHKTVLQIGYARVSSADNRQELGLAVQKEALKTCDLVLIEKESGGKEERPQLQKALALAKTFARQGVTVTLVVYKLDRLTRRMFQLADLLQDLTRHGVQLKSLQENIETNSLTGRFFCLILGYVAEWELEAIRTRTRDGLKKAKERGVKLGNRGLSKTREEQIIQAYLSADKSMRELAQELQISTATLYSVLHRNHIRTKGQKST